MSNIQYAVTEDGAHVGYRVLEPEEPSELEIVMVSGGMIPLEVMEEEVGFARMLEGLRGFARVIVFDRRGVGASDPVIDWERPVLEQWADDLRAVVDASTRDEVIVYAWDTFGVATRFATRGHPKLKQLVLFQPRGGSDEVWRKWTEQRIARLRSSIGSNDDDLFAELAPSRANDPTFREWYERAGRVGASPTTADRIWQSVFGSLGDDQNFEDITVPTLVLNRPDNLLLPPGVVDLVAKAIPNAKWVELEGQDSWPFVGDVDAVVAEISEFVTGERRVPAPDRMLAAVLFTDLVDSTKRAASLGDATWKRLLDRHDRAIRDVVSRCGGTVVKTTGDGVLALFPAAGVAVRAAARLREELARDDLQIRVGIHVGDVDRRGEDVSGLAVNIAARVMSKAGDGEIALTAAATGAMAGEAVKFESLGAHDLKGVPGPWELFRLV